MRAWLLNHLGLKILSVVLAIILWAIVLGEQKVDVTVNIPLEFKDLPRNLTLVNEPVDTLAVRLRGPRTLVTTLAPREVSLEGLPKTLVEGDNVVQIRLQEVRVPRGIEVVDVTPHRVRVILDAMGEREVEVSPRVEGAPPKGFEVRRVTANPARVRMTGPRSELRRLQRVYTLPVSIEGQNASFIARTTLEPLGRQIRMVQEAPILVEVEIEARKT